MSIVVKVRYNLLFSRVCHQFYHSLRRNSSTLSPPLATIGVISSDLSVCLALVRILVVQFGCRGCRCYEAITLKN